MERKLPDFGILKKIPFRKAGQRESAEPAPDASAPRPAREPAVYGAAGGFDRPRPASPDPFGDTGAFQPAPDTASRTPDAAPTGPIPEPLSAPVPPPASGTAEAFHAAAVRKRPSAAARKKRRKLIRTVILALLLLAAGIFLFRRFRGRSGGGDDMQILTDVVQYGSIMSKVEGTGLTRARNSETMTIPFSGTVMEVFIEEGDLVAAGDLLYTVDSEEARDAVTSAEDAAQSARDEVSRAQDGVETAREAVQTARDGVTKAQEGVTRAREAVRTAQDGVVKAQEGVQTAQEGVQTARDRVADAERDLLNIQKKAEDLTLKAPWQGNLRETKSFLPGDSVSEGETVATLVDDTRMRLTQYYSYAYVQDLYEGQSVEVSVPSLTSTLPGTVEEIHMVSRVTEEGSRLFSADIVVDNQGGQGGLTEGVSATAVAVVDGEQVYPYEAGKLAYYRSTALKAGVGGEVLTSRLEDYQPVSEGQVLLTISGEDLDEKIADARQVVKDRQKAVSDAQQGVEDARTRVTDAEKGVTDAQRGVTEAEDAVETAKKGVTDAETGVTDAQKRVEEKQKSVEEALKKIVDARESLAKCEAVAPIDGKVVGLDLYPGEEFASGKAAVTISDTTSLVVNATVDERNMSYVKKGMEVELDQWDTPAFGVVESISLSSTVNNGVATYPMVIAVDNADDTLQINSNITYSLIASQSDNCLVVPIQCVRTVADAEGKNVTVVYVEAEEPPEGALEDAVNMMEEIPEGYWPVPVEIGIQDSYNVEIRSGLEEGMTVFTQMQASMGFGMMW